MNMATATARIEAPGIEEAEKAARQRKFERALAYKQYSEDQRKKYAEVFPSKVAEMQDALQTIEQEGFPADLLKQTSEKLGASVSKLESLQAKSPDPKRNEDIRVLRDSLNFLEFQKLGEATETEKKKARVGADLDRLQKEIEADQKRLEELAQQAKEGPLPVVTGRLIEKAPAPVELPPLAPVTQKETPRPVELAAPTELTPAEVTELRRARREKTLQEMAAKDITPARLKASPAVAVTREMKKPIPAPAELMPEPTMPTARIEKARGLSPSEVMEKFAKFDGAKRDLSAEKRLMADLWKDSANDEETNRNFLKVALSLQPQYGEDAIDRAKQAMQERLLEQEMLRRVQDDVVNGKDRKLAYAFLKDRMPKGEPAMPSVSTALAPEMAPRIVTPTEMAEEVEAAWYKAEPQERIALETKEKLSAEERAELERAIRVEQREKKIKPETLTRAERKEIEALPRPEGEMITTEKITEEELRELENDLKEIPRPMFPWAKRWSKEISALLASVAAATAISARAPEMPEAMRTPPTVSAPTPETIPAPQKERKVSVTLGEEEATVLYKPAEREFVDQVVSAMKAGDVDINPRDIGRIYGEVFAAVATQEGVPKGGFEAAMKRELKNVIQAETMGKIKSELRKVGKDTSDEAVWSTFKKYITTLALRFTGGESVGDKDIAAAMKSAAQEI